MPPALLLSSCSSDANACVPVPTRAALGPVRTATQLTSRPASRGRSGSSMSQSPPRPRARGLSTATGVPSAALSRWCQDRTAPLGAEPTRLGLCEKRPQGLEVPEQESGRGGKREAKLRKNSQWPAKAYRGPDVAPTHSGHVRVVEGSVGAHASLWLHPKLCCREGAHKGNPRKLKAPKWSKEKKNLAKLNGFS